MRGPQRGRWLWNPMQGGRTARQERTTVSKAGYMHFPHRTRVALVVAAWLLLATGSAADDESGTFSMVRVSIAKYTTVEHGEGSAFAGPLEGTSTVVRSSGAPFVEREHSVMRCVAYGKQSDAGMDLEVPCAATDADGHKFDTLAVRTAGGVEAGGGGRRRHGAHGCDRQVRRNLRHVRVRRRLPRRQMARAPGRLRLATPLSEHSARVRGGPRPTGSRAA